MSPLKSRCPRKKDNSIYYTDFFECMLSKLGFSDFSRKIYAFLLTFVLLVSTITLFSPQSEAENDEIWMEVYFHHDDGHFWSDVWFEGNYSKNYTVVWSILDEGGTVMDYDYKEFSDNGSSEHYMWIEVNMSSYSSGVYNYTVDLYEENTVVAEFEDDFEVHPWLMIDFPYHLLEAADVNLSVSVAAAVPNTNYSIEWYLMDYDTEDSLMDNSTNFTDYNWILNLSEGHYELEVSLYEEVSSNNSGNDTWWAKIDHEYMRLYIGGSLLWMDAWSGDDYLYVEMGVEFADFDTNYTAVWNITDYFGNLIDNGITGFPNSEPWHYLQIPTANYSAGDYWINVDLYSGAANSTDTYESSAHQSFWIHAELRAWTEGDDIENDNVTIFFTSYHINASRDYRIEWYLYDWDEYDMIVDDTFNASSGNVTINFLETGDYRVEARLYEWAPMNNGTDWNWTYLDYGSHHFHVGGAQLDVWYWFGDDQDLHFEGCVQYADWEINYTGNWTITDGNNMLVDQGAIPFDDWGENCFFFDLPADDFEWGESYTVVFDLYENGTYLNNYTFDFDVYLLFYFHIDYSWDEGSYVNGTYFINTDSEDYRLAWFLDNEDNFMTNGSFDSNSENGMLEFFNIPEGFYNLHIQISLDQFNCNNCTNNTYYNDTYYFYYYFEVEDDPFVEPNTAPYCDLHGNIASGDNINALTGDTFTFGMDCLDDDGDNMILSAAVDSSNFPTPFLFGDVTVNTSSWTYTFSTTGLYIFGLSVVDVNGGQSSYTFTVNVLDNNTGCQPNNDLNAVNLTDGECCSSGAQCASGNCNYTTWTCEADNTTNNNTTNNNTANNNTANNNTGTNETEELLEEIEASEVPSISVLVSAVTIALIAFRRRNNW